MEIRADVLSLTQSTAIITHKGEQAKFVISNYQKKNFQEEHDVFEHLNEYWKWLPENQQDTIFQIYKDFDAIFNSFASRDEIRAELIEKTNELMSYHTLNNVERFILHHSDIRIPSHIVVSYKDDINTNTTRDKTYIRADYHKLIVMCLALRCMLPIWGQEIHRIRRDVGNRYKETQAFELISQTEILQSEAYAKLSTYVEGIIEKDKENTSMIIEGISPERYGEWVVSMICVLRLTIGDIRGIEDPTRDMCRYIFRFITQKVRNNDGNNENGIRDKMREPAGSDGENKTSTIERFKQTTDITVGEEAELQMSLEDPFAVARSMEARVTDELLDSCLQSVQMLKNARIAQPQETLVAWLLKQITTPYATEHVEEETLIDLIGTMEAVLWARGHEYLALLISAYPVNDESIQVISGGESRARIPAEMLDEIEKYYPCTRPVNSRSMGRDNLDDQMNRKVVTAQKNDVIESIDMMAANLAYHSWRPTASSDKLEKVLGTSVRRLPIRPTIKIDLARLVIEIGSRSYLNY